MIGPGSTGDLNLTNGGPGRTRTSDTRFRKPLLCPLSYGAMCLGKSTTGLGPGLSGRARPSGGRPS